MNSHDLVSMTDRDLKSYILTHPDEQAAFDLYMDRRNARTEEFTILEPDDPELDSKFMTAIQHQIDRTRNA